MKYWVFLVLCLLIIGGVFALSLEKINDLRSKLVLGNTLINIEIQKELDIKNNIITNYTISGNLVVKGNIIIDGCIIYDGGVLGKCV
jgi:hypothetical protein